MLKSCEILIKNHLDKFPSLACTSNNKFGQYSFYNNMDCQISSKT